MISRIAFSLASGEALNCRPYWLPRTSSLAVTEREEVVHGTGRVRDVVCGPDGTLFVVLNDPHRIVRLVPATKAGAKGKGTEAD